MNITKRYATLDIFRLIAAFLIIAIHTSPFLSINETADFIIVHIIARVAVPFFFMVTGYFLYLSMEKGNKLRRTLNKLIGIYIIGIFLYLPLNLYGSYFSQENLPFQITKDLIFDGTFYHLWYLPATIIGILLVQFLLRRFRMIHVFIITIVLYVIGLGGDSYYGIVTQISTVHKSYDFLFKIMDYTRSGLFFAPVYLFLGSWIAYSKHKIKTEFAVIGLIISNVLLMAEGLLLHNFNVQRHDSMYIMLLPSMYFLFLILLQCNGNNIKELRTLSMVIYIIHPWMIVIVRLIAKILHLQNLLIYNNLLHFLSVSILSLLAGLIVIYFFTRLKQKGPGSNSRAWVEVDLNALVHNAFALKECLPKKCELMAVVKAGAYGHGDVETAKALNKAGFHAFAVATLTEGIRLRKNGVKGEILILGYTNPSDVNYLTKYKLTQTVLNYDYGKSLNESSKQVKVHIKIDTGMHRLGEDYDGYDNLEHIYELNNLKIEGMFTHLCTSDSLKDTDITFSKLQIERFYETIRYLQAKGYDTGKLHIQSSYGILNYPELECDYVRAGIALYGVLSDRNNTRLSVDLKPVLSLKARVSIIKNIKANESVSYGRLFTAKQNMKVATVTIGYADGVPRNLFEADTYVLLHSQKAPVIGRICMDQFVIDVTDIDDVRPGDIVTIIGNDGEEQIYCEDFATECGTISNEILSRLGSRLGYIFKH
ncbi:serine racemase VanT catalytic subunit [Anaerocolumna aminovalerica]|uniref:serine racemase VanT catalytic subunit n=1 Tax=Anaerocolumna aminovalerica TaxID=1527 RepID=UPI000BE40774|nr:serine racemase VanT catalytic subunit [Anaerocolumna aminovalerica]